MIGNECQAAGEAVAKAKRPICPNDNIIRPLKGFGELNDAIYEEITYERTLYMVQAGRR